MKYTETFKVDTHHCDVNENLKAADLLRFMQECATGQLEHSNMAQKNLNAAGKTYVLCRLYMSIYKPAKLFDKIEVSTWPCESRGLSFKRCYQAKLNGSVIADAVSVWGIIDIERRKFCKVSEFDFDIDCDAELEIDAPSRIHIPPEAKLKLVGERPICYSDLDLNGHVNNTNYPAIYCDFLPDFEKKRIIKLSINYTSEVKGGDTLRIYIAEYDGQYYIRTLKDDGTVNSEAIIMTEEI